MELEKELEGNETTALYEYEDLSFNVLTGNASARKVLFKDDNIEIKAEEVLIQDLSYYQYITSGKFQIGELEVKRPVILYREKKLVPEDSLQAPKEETTEDIRIKSLKLSDGILRVVKNDSTSETLYLGFKNLALSELLSDKNIRKENLPFEYGSIEMESDSLSYDLNEEHLLLVENINYKNGDLELKNFNVIPKYSVSEFDRKIPYEKDRIDLEVESIKLNNFNWNIINDSLKVSSHLIDIETAHLEVYRNKLLPDDDRIKPLYSEMIRNFGFRLDLDSIRINDMEIVYREKVQQERPPGELIFGEVQAVIENVSNIPDSIDSKKTKITAEALFMNKAPLTMELEFEVLALNDEFHVSGMMGAIRAETLNPFLKPAMNVETKGVINSLFYDFYGNRVSAKGDMKLAYEDFKVTILKEGEEKEKSFLSSLANLFINNNAVNEKVNQENLEVTRDQTKSFWNFLWLCIREGAIKGLL